MFHSLNIAATGMNAQETQLEGIANNIANANTHGFKKQRVDFQDLLYQSVTAPGTETAEGTTAPEGTQIGSGVMIAGTTRIFSHGSTQISGNALDLAIEGRLSMRGVDALRGRGELRSSYGSFFVQVEAIELLRLTTEGFEVIPMVDSELRASVEQDRAGKARD